MRVKGLSSALPFSAPWPGLALYLAAYGCALVLLLPLLSLWLDEILFLIGVRNELLLDLPAYAARNGGGVPLGYIFSSLSVKLLGYSAFAGRLPSLIFSLGSCVGIYFLTAPLRIRHQILAVAVFSLIPLQFRYAIEARPYSAALCFTIWCTVAFLALVDKPAPWRSLAYGLAVILGLFTQPYTIFVPAAHFVWALTARRRGAVRTAGMVLAVAGALFVPWFLYGAPFWRAEIASDVIQSHYGFAEVLLILKELVGLGYLGTALVLGLSYLGLRRIDSEFRSFWLLLIGIPIAGAVLADMALGYFVAIRQMIFVLTPLALLATLGIEQVSLAGTRRWAAVVACVLFAVCTYKNVHLFLRPRVDWRAAAQALVEASASGACIQSVPHGSAPLFAFFEPSISERLCASESPETSQIVVGVSPYDPSQSFEAVHRSLTAANWAATAVHSFAGPRVVLYSRTP